MNNDLNKKEKSLFTVKGMLNIEQFKDYTKVFKLSIWLNFILLLILILFILLIKEILSNNPSIGNVIKEFGSIMGTCFIITIFSRKNIIEKNYKIWEKETKDKEYTIEFYDDYFIKKNSYSIRRADYIDIEKIIETNDYFHIIYLNADFIVNKKGLHEDQIDFIRNTNNKVYKCKMKEYKNLMMLK